MVDINCSLLKNFYYNASFPFCNMIELYSIFKEHDQTFLQVFQIYHGPLKCQTSDSSVNSLFFQDDA